MEAKKKPRSGTPGNMKEQLKKATSEMLVLYLLREKPRYTYELMQEMAQRSEGVITFNTLYLTIYRLQEHQYIEEQEKKLSPDNRVRIYFGITAQGETYLDQMIQEYRVFTSAVDRMIGESGE